MIVAPAARPAKGDDEVRARPASAFTLRRAGDGTLTLAGHASVFDTPYDVYGGPPFGWTETMVAGCCDKTLRERPDVQLLINHEGMPLARTKSGTLRLATDSVGLGVQADLEARSVTVQELALAMDRGDIDEMSFGFRVLRQEWNEDYTERKILEVSLHRGDVSVVNYGANPATSATLRALEALGSLQPAELLGELRRQGCGDPSSLIDRAIEVLTGAAGSGAGVRGSRSGGTLAEAQAELLKIEARDATIRGRAIDHLAAHVASQRAAGPLTLDEARARLAALGPRR